MNDKEIADYIHYPNCWDTINYPTLASALFEFVDLDTLQCTQCSKGPIVSTH